jgi:Domain of unknown function (DUF4365)
VRAGPNEATGTSGETEVLAEFERLGWAGMLDDRHDTGTDLYLRPRDARRFELGVVMGAQVKAGPTWFKRPQLASSGQPEGWWFSEDSQEHFDDWLQHALPHILVLRDQNTNRSYWVHITRESVQVTGKGAKILVPANQVIDAEHNADLTAVAMTQLAGYSWEGTVWTGFSDIASGDELRHALIAPRLVAPHPNHVPGAISGVQALAMQIQMRPELERLFVYPERPATPRPDADWAGLRMEEALVSGDWAWRAAAALSLWYYRGDASALEMLVDQAVTSAEQAAAVVLNCVLRFEQNDPDSVLLAVDSVLDRDHLTPVDQSWVSVQKARALSEVGRHEEAFDLAIMAQKVHRNHPRDVTASAISGAAQSIAFHSTHWMHGDIGELIQGLDNRAAWWRSQAMGYGLAEHLTRSYRRWAKDRAVRFGSSDPAQRHLRAASILASVVGDQGEWRKAMEALGEHLCMLVVTSDQEVASALDLLRRAGARQSLTLAVKRTIQSGPIAAVIQAAKAVDLTHSSRTSVGTDFALLTAAGDLLDEIQADALVDWCLLIFVDADSWLTRTTPGFILFNKLIELLHSMLWSMSNEARAKVIEFILSLPAISDSGRAQDVARLVRSMPDEAWTQADRDLAGQRAAHDAPFLQEALLAIGSPARKDSHSTVLDRARSGDLMIIGAIHSVQDLPADAVEALAESASQSLRTSMAATERGQYGYGGPDLGRFLSILAIFHPEQARWEAIEALLASETVDPADQVGCLKVLAARPDVIPEATAVRLRDTLAKLRERPPRTISPIVGTTDVRGLAAEVHEALAVVKGGVATARALSLGDAQSRVSAARLASRSSTFDGVDVLIGLAHDNSDEVRRAALEGLATKIRLGDGDENLLKWLLSRIQRGGLADVYAILRGLNDDGSFNEPTMRILDAAMQHVSARVRRHASQLKANRMRPT